MIENISIRPFKIGIWRSQWQVTNDLVYEDQQIKIPSGFIFDGASVPTLARRLICKTIIAAIFVYTEGFVFFCGGNTTMKLKPSVRAHSSQI